MWRAVLWLFLTPAQLPLSPCTPGDAADLLYEDSEDADVDFNDFDNSEDNSTDTLSTMTTDDAEFLTRLRRFGDQAAGQTLNHYDIQKAKGALNQIMANRRIEALTTTDRVKSKIIFSKLATSLHKEHFQKILHDLMAKRAVSYNFTDEAESGNEIFKKISDDSSEGNEDENHVNADGLIGNESVTQNNIPAKTRSMLQFFPIFEARNDNTLNINEFKDIHSEYTILPHMSTGYVEHFKPVTVNQNTDSQEEFEVPNTAKFTNEYVTAVATVDINVTNMGDTSGNLKFWSHYDLDYNTVNAIQLLSTTIHDKPRRSTLNPARQQKDKAARRSKTINSRKDDTNATASAPIFDMPALLDIIANLTLDYGTNLTMRFNETFQKFQMPTCNTPTTTDMITENPVENAMVVGKCFVCGLTTPGIPRDAYCADAFAGDFLPLVPVDPKARGQIARYRKYCRFLDVSGVKEFPEEPRSMFGRFTGGCSVRWIDLSGVYTQRACRNRRRAHTGKHFLSKRMAKLEMALAHVDNGCIVSPMASLVPLSRGISLYARFHACVCTGSWCNRGVLNQPWTANIIFLAICTLEGIIS